MIFGAKAKESGTILLNGKEINPKSPREAIDLGIACAGVVFGAAITAAGGAMAWVFVAQGTLMLACTAAGTVALRGCRQDRDGTGNHPA